MKPLILATIHLLLVALPAQAHPQIHHSKEAYPAQGNTLFIPLYWLPETRQMVAALTKSTEVFLVIPLGDLAHDMTSEQLIEEGRKLQRDCVFLRPQGGGSVVAIWHEHNDDEIEATGHRCWLTVDARHVPGFPPSVTGYLSVWTDEENCKGGRVDVSPSWPERAGTELYAHPASVLPPIDAVFARGFDAVGEWLGSHGWKREWRYNDNFKGREVAREYERAWQREHPIYLESDIYAVLGGWHLPMADDDWKELLDDQLMVFTLRDSEPWVEAWRMRTGEFRVMRRIT